MKSVRIRFANAQGEQLAARLEMPEFQHPTAFALFAHCFTCNKNLVAIRNISRALTAKGIAVLRFDFTGLGESEGDFADTNFSSNVQDLIAAAKYLETEYQAPSLLIGHSLGGAAVLFAGAQLPFIQAIATIGAPASPKHVAHLFQHGIEEIEATGKATLKIGGRAFTIKKQFLEDINEQNINQAVKGLGKALLVMHSPQDTIVEVDNAASIYRRAEHPKSFISLDGADHLLSKKKDSLYVGEVIASWANRYLEKSPSIPLKTDKQVAVRLAGDKFTSEIQAGKHAFLADEPESVGGDDFGPSPYQLLSASLGACTVMTLRMYANRKKWDLKSVTVHLEHYKQHLEASEDGEKKTRKADIFDRTLELHGNLDAKQRERLLEIANRCPVHRTLHGEIVVNSKLLEG